MTGPTTRSWMKPLYLLLGLVALGVGVAGVFLPLVPTVGPLLVAAFAFSRSSDRLHHWLVNHKRFGRLIADFQAGRGLPMKTKVVGVVAMTAAFTYSIGWVLAHPALRVLVALVGLWAIWYVLHFPTTRPD